MREEKDDLLVRIADAQIEANRFRRKYEEVQAEYKQLRVDTGRLCLTAIVVGVIIGTVVGLAIGLMF
nr:MAG TPA: YtxH-like protein [Caudoviricetes sp.]